MIIFCAVKVGPRLFQNTQNIPITNNISQTSSRNSLPPGFKSFQQVVDAYKVRMINDKNVIEDMCYAARNSPSLLGKSYDQYLNEQIQKHLAALTDFDSSMAVKYTANKQLFKKYCPGTY